MVTSPLGPQDLIQAINGLRLPADEYVVGAQGTMLLRGQQPREHVDLLVTPSLYARLRDEGWTETEDGRALTHGTLRALTEDDGFTYRRENARLIQNAQVVDGVPFVRIADVHGAARPAVQKKATVAQPPFPNAFAFLGAVLRDSESAFFRARNQTFWRVAFLLTATVEATALVRPLGLGALPLAAVIAGVSLLLAQVQGSMARSLCGDKGAASGPVGSQLLLIGAALAIPLGAMVLLGAPSLLLLVMLLVWIVVNTGAQVALFSTAFEVNTKSAANVIYVIPAGAAVLLLPVIVALFTGP